VVIVMVMVVFVIVIGGDCHDGGVCDCDWW
jgi:hypothetical protein